MTGPDAPFLRTLCSLRWLAVGGQAATILVATWVLGLPLPQLPLWAGVAVLALFNIYTQLRPDAADTAPLTAFGHILVDVIILTWMVGWSGGMANPFSSLFLILIALAAVKAGSNDRTAIRDALRDVASAPGEKVGPGDYAKAVELLKAGKDINYEGAAGSQDFDENGDVPGTIGMWSFEDGKIVDGGLIDLN